MVTPIFDISDGSRVGVARAAREGEDSLRYRLDVLAAAPTSVADVVQSAGGWLYDRMMAGWEVTVLLPDASNLRNTRPLRILGALATDLDSAENAMTGQSLAVSAAAFSADGRVRDTVRDALDRPSTEVALWGDGLPVGFDRRMAKVQHKLSAAARVFKGYALTAAGISCAAIDPVETMLCSPSACLPVDSELIRLGWR
jgi:hypothetical protein